jgi:bifunctional non-homologous end joining protein LigD
MPLFVVHEHHSKHLHYDFRLETEGVLKSWAVPKGPSLNPKEKRLAVLVEDHTIEYGSYEGIIPEGHYGAGAVIIWDKGEYTIEGGSIDKGRIELNLKGEKLKGRFVLARMSGKEKEWLLMKKADEFSTIDFRIETALTPSILKRLKEKIPPCKAY